MKRNLLLVVMAVCLALAATPCIGSQVWDFAADFSISSGNPHGDWTYGYRIPTTGMFAASAYTGQTESFIYWVADGTGSLGGVILKNYTSQPVVSGGAYVVPGQATMHPGETNQCDVRWTAPRAMWVKTEGEFAELAGGSCDTHVFLNGGSLADGIVTGYLLAPPDYTQPSGTPQFTFSQTLHVVQGDKIDFVLGVGSDGNWDRGTTGLQAIITELIPGQVAGRVSLDASGDPPIAGATVKASGTSTSATTDGDGYYSIQLLPGDHTLRATADGCAPLSRSVRVPEGNSVTCNFVLSPVTPAAVARIGEIRALLEGTPVTITAPKVVTVSPATSTDGCYYVEEPDRASGIRISPASYSQTVTEGDRVTLTGTLAVNGDGERTLEETVVQTREPGQNVPALAMTNRSVRASIGVDRTGLLVRIWGRVSHKSPDGACVYLDDGSKCANGSGSPTGVMVALDHLAIPISPIPELGNYVTVTGVAGYASVASDSVRVVRPRRAADIIGIDTGGDDASLRSQWFQTHLGPSASTVPFAFTYAGQPSSAVLERSIHTCDVIALDDVRTQVIHTYMDPQTDLQLRCVGVEYSDFPTLEWTVYLKNTGSTVTPILENVQALDSQLTRGAGGEFILHHIDGLRSQITDFQPLDDTMPPGSSKTIADVGGRPANGDLSYFNIEWPGQGVIMAIGWPGEWAAKFTRDAGTNMRTVVGQSLTHLKLYPGEEIRTPLVALQFWTGTRVDSQNVWRRWMVAHNMPHPNGTEPLEPQFGGCWGNMQPTAAEEIAEINGYLADDIVLDHWIIDAGWYPGFGSWWNVGTWEPDYARFPYGLREVADVLHASNIKFIVWFEPARVSSGTWLALNHPEWILGGNGGGIFNMGNPAAREWMIDHIDSTFTEQGINILRNDYNINPVPYWRGNDSYDRQGITENLFAQGWLMFWDELLRRRQGMWIDSWPGCLETTRRSVCILRTDWTVGNFTVAGAIGQQCHSQSVSSWLPYSGTGAPTDNLYTLRSSYAPIYRIGYDALSPTRPLALMKQAVSESKSLEPYWLADYYPLTPYSLATDVWMAWQFDSPEEGGGFVQAFRRENSTIGAMQFRLGGLDAASDYLLTNQDTQVTQRISGRTLIDEGLQIALPVPRSSALYIYKKAN